MPVTRATLHDSAQLRSDVGTEADQSTRDLTTAWVAAWVLLALPTLAAASSIVATAVRLGRWPGRWELARIPGVQSVLDAASQALDRLGARTVASVTGAAGRAIAATVPAQARLIASQLPAAERDAAAARFAGKVLPRAVDVMRARVWQQIETAARPLSTLAADAMRRELVRGVRLGDDPQTVAQAMVDRVQGAFEGALSRAITIARTEILDAHRVAGQYVDLANADVLSGWRWQCQLGPKTCPSCLAMNGTLHDLAEPGPLDHVAGRCQRVPTLRPWAELGLGNNEPADRFPDARAWFGKQPHEVQVGILGAARLDLLQSGLVGWDDLAARRESNAWRPSYVPTTVRDLQRLAGQRSRVAA